MNKVVTPRLIMLDDTHSSILVSDRVSFNYSYVPFFHFILNLSEVSGRKSQFDTCNYPTTVLVALLHPFQLLEAGSIQNV